MAFSVLPNHHYSLKLKPQRSSKNSFKQIGISLLISLSLLVSLFLIPQSQTKIMAAPNELTVNATLYYPNDKLTSITEIIENFFFTDEEEIPLDTATIKEVSENVYAYSFSFKRAAQTLGTRYDAEISDFALQSNKITAASDGGQSVDIVLAPKRTIDFQFDDNFLDGEPINLGNSLNLAVISEGKTQNWHVDRYETEPGEPRNVFYNDTNTGLLIDFTGKAINAPDLQIVTPQKIKKYSLTNYTRSQAGNSFKITLTKPATQILQVAIPSDLANDLNKPLSIRANGDFYSLNANQANQKVDNFNYYSLNITTDLKPADWQISLDNRPILGLLKSQPQSKVQLASHYDQAKACLFVDGPARDVYFSVISPTGEINFNTLFQDHIVKDAALIAIDQQTQQIYHASFNRDKYRFASLPFGHTFTIKQAEEQLSEQFKATYFPMPEHILSISNNFTALLDGNGPNGTRDTSLDKPSLNGKTPFKLCLARRPELSKLIVADNQDVKEIEAKNGDIVNFKLQLAFKAPINYQIQMDDLFSVSCLHNQIALVDVLDPRLEFVADSLKITADNGMDPAALQANYDANTKSITLNYQPDPLVTKIVLDNNSFKADHQFTPFTYTLQFQAKVNFGEQVSDIINTINTPNGTVKITPPLNLQLNKSWQGGTALIPKAETWLASLNLVAKDGDTLVKTYQDLNSLLDQDQSQLANWQFSFSNLPKYNPDKLAKNPDDKAALTYEFVETKTKDTNYFAPLYQVTNSHTQITNYFTNATQTLKLQKLWVNKDKSQRQVSLTFNLQAPQAWQLEAEATPNKALTTYTLSPSATPKPLFTWQHYQVRNGVLETVTETATYQSSSQGNQEIYQIANLPKFWADGTTINYAASESVQIAGLSTEEVQAKMQAQSEPLKDAAGNLEGFAFKNDLTNIPPLNPPATTTETTETTTTTETKETTTPTKPENPTPKETTQPTITEPQLQPKQPGKTQPNLPPRYVITKTGELKMSSACFLVLALFGLAALIWQKQKRQLNN